MQNITELHTFNYFQVEEEEKFKIMFLDKQFRFLQFHSNVSGLLDHSSFISVGYNEAGKKLFTCQMCGKSFKKNAHVKTHIENVHDGAQVQCGVCNKVLKNRETLITHSRVQHGLTKDQTYY